MGKKRRILFSPKFAHLRKVRFGSKSNFEEQQKIEEQEPIEETPVLKMVEEQVKIAKEKKSVVAETPTPVLKAAKEELAPKPKTATVPKKRAATRSRTVKPRAKKTTSKK